MSKDKFEADRRVIEKVKLKPNGASALDIAKAYLGPRARRHTVAALNQIGLGVAARLCGAGQITPTRSNNFVLARREVAA